MAKIFFCWISLIETRSITSISWSMTSVKISPLKGIYIYIYYSCSPHTFSYDKISCVRCNCKSRKLTSNQCIGIFMGNFHHLSNYWFQMGFISGLESGIKQRLSEIKCEVRVKHNDLIKSGQIYGWPY